MSNGYAQCGGPDAQTERFPPPHRFSPARMHKLCETCRAGGGFINQRKDKTRRKKDDLAGIPLWRESFLTFSLGRARPPRKILRGLKIRRMRMLHKKPDIQKY
jgi:hypothetical protein